MQATRYRDERGQNTVLVALSMVAFVAMLALVLDGSLIFMQRRRMQNAADAAALAGSRALALDKNDTEIDSVIQQYVDLNTPPNASEDVTYEAWYYCDPDSGDCTQDVAVGDGFIPDWAQTVQVVTRIEFPTFFAGRLVSTVSASTLNEQSIQSSGPAPEQTSQSSGSTFSVFADSKGTYGFPAALTGLAPLAMKYREDFQVSTDDEEHPYEIWDSDKVSDAPEDCQGDPVACGIIIGGNRGWLNFDGGDVGNDEIKEWMASGFGGNKSVGEWINGSPGTRTSSFKSAQIGQRLIIPMYDNIRSRDDRPEGEDIGNGSIDYQIVAFAAFRVTGVDNDGSVKRLIGHFEYHVPAGEWGGLHDTGIRVVKLTP